MMVLQALLPLLTEQEQAVVRRGKNASKATVAKHATPEEYRASTALEALFGWLYLQNRFDRIEELFAVIVKTRMEQEQTARFQNLLGAVHKKLIITASHMLCHPYAHHPVKGPVHLWQIPVIHKRNLQKISQLLLLDTTLKRFVLPTVHPHSTTAQSLFSFRLCQDNHTH